MEYDRPHKTKLFSPSIHLSVGFYDESGVESLGQALRVSDPVTGLALAGRFVVTQLAVQFFDQFDAVTQRCVDRMSGFSVKVGEIIQTIGPVTFAAQLAKVTAIVGRLEQAVMRTVSFCDYFLHQ